LGLQRPTPAPVYLIFPDINMPLMDGIEVWQQIKRNTHFTPFLLVLYGLKANYWAVQNIFADSYHWVLYEWLIC
jgi:CheY-like chemotaxis protein